MHLFLFFPDWPSQNARVLGIENMQILLGKCRPSRINLQNSQTSMYWKDQGGKDIYRPSKAYSYFYLFIFFPFFMVENEIYLKNLMYFYFCLNSQFENNHFVWHWNRA